MAAVVVLTTIRLLLSSDPSLGASMTMRVLSPNVEIARGSAGPFTAAADGDVIGEGDRARTDANGAGIINFFDGSSLTLDPSTEIGVVAIDERSSGVVASFTQAIGRTWSSVHKQTGAPRYEIKTPAATAVVRGTAFEIIVRADGFTTVRVSEGTVAVTAQGVTVLVEAGFETIITPGQPPSTPTASVVTALRVALRAPSPGGPFVALVDRLGRTCGIIDPATVGVAGPTTLAVNQIPRCVSSAPTGGVATAEVGSPTTGAYTVVVLGGQASAATFTLEVSGVLGGTLTFDHGAAGDVVKNEIEAAQLTLTSRPDGGPATTGLSQLSRFYAAPIAPGTQRTGGGPAPSATPAATVAAGASASPTPSPSPSRSPGASPSSSLPFMTLLRAGPVEFVPVTGGSPLADRPTLVPPPGAGVSLGFILGSGALMIGALFILKDFMQPIFVAASAAGITAFIAGGLSLLFFYRDFLIATFYTIGRILR